MRRILGLALTAHALDVRNLKPQRIMRKALGGAAASLACASLVLSPTPALAAKASNAASSAGSRVNKDPQSLLRNGLPVKGKCHKKTRSAPTPVRGGAAR